MACSLAIPSAVKPFSAIPVLKYGKKQLFVPFKMDYFAVSLPDLLIFKGDLQKRHELYCHFLMGLGYLAINHLKKSKKGILTYS